MEPLCKNEKLALISDDQKRKKVDEILSCLLIDDVKIQSFITTFEDQIKLANSPDENLRKQTNLFWENTYVRRLLDGNENGVFLGMDLGGTNFRIVLVRFKDGCAETTTKYYNLDKELLSGPSSGIFEHIAVSLQSFVQEENLPKNEKILLGFTFSFPSVQKSLKESTIQTWTKSIKCTDGPGLDSVKLLEEAIEKKGGLPVPVDVVARISDTTGTLLAGNYLDKNCRIGLILGTGSNAAFVEHVSNIEKWDSCYKDDEDSSLVVINCEFGALGDNGCMDFIKTEFDRELDQHSNHMGSYTFEKLYAGHYLGELVRLVLVKMIRGGVLFNGIESDKLFERWKFTTAHVTAIESDEGTDSTKTMQVLEEFDLHSVATEEDVMLVREVCAIMSQRGAFIVASAMVVLLHHISLPEVTIAVDGSLYENHPKYHSHMMEVISKWAPKTRTKMMLVKDGSGQGGAIVASIESKKRSSC
ncbi:hypothetical protein ACJMK2_028591 [Sinanodonta woodiana]|uniref:Phosphotransferase n=1 Tax=Sinanodonta woodiana TaxID=1069815 RepID=A0ABD3X7K7_SINWO